MPADSLDAVFSALADPTRRAILARLIAGETSVTRLAEPFDMSMPAVSKHLKVLENAGLVERGSDAQMRPRRLVVGPLKQAVGWFEPYRAIWEQKLDRLGAHLERVQGERVQGKKPRQRKRSR
jgi:DNA-binding transcriptional ArsR family regulator